jgi:hypothetical protein
VGSVTVERVRRVGDLGAHVDLHHLPRRLSELGVDVGDRVSDGSAPGRRPPGQPGSVGRPVAVVVVDVDDQREGSRLTA